MSSWGQICPWHDISLAVVVERVDYLFKNQKHDSTITYYTIPISTSALSRRGVPPRAVHVKLFGLTQKGRMVGCLLFLSVWITHHKTHIHINYILLCISIVGFTCCRTGNMSSSCLAKRTKANYLKIERKKKNQTMHSLVIIQLYFWLILEWIIQW